MELIFLGTSGAMPTLERSTTCICLVRDREILMFDAGEGAQISYLKSNLGWNKKMKIFVTHLHGDHCIGILGLFDPASKMGLNNGNYYKEDYGQTLGRWGVGEGCYIVLPILGPSTVRDTVGSIATFTGGDAWYNITVERDTQYFSEASLKY